MRCCWGSNLVGRFTHLGTLSRPRSACWTRHSVQQWLLWTSQATSCCPCDPPRTLSSSSLLRHVAHQPHTGLSCKMMRMDARGQWLTPCTPVTTAGNSWWHFLAAARVHCVQSNRKRGPRGGARVVVGELWWPPCAVITDERLGCLPQSGNARHLKGLLKCGMQPLGVRYHTY